MLNEWAHGAYAVSFSLLGGGNYGCIKDFADGLKMFARGLKL